MTYGVDTSFLVQLEVREVTGHRPAHQLKEKLIREKATLALVPQILCEFIHVVTDARRFERPLSVEEAVERSEFWWNLREVAHLSVTSDSVRTFHRWMKQHRLGRKRILDTMLASIYEAHEVRNVITSDVEGFSCFGCFDIIDPVRQVKSNG
jgi:predicted nucleic acid-binding protein